MKVFGIIVLALLLFVGLPWASTYVYWQYYYPWQMGQQFSGVRKSNPYVTTQQTSLISLYAGYQKLETLKQTNPNVDVSGQESVIVLQMQQQAALIPAEQIPIQIRQFLATHQ